MKDPTPQQLERLKAIAGQAKRLSPQGCLGTAGYVFGHMSEDERGQYVRYEDLRKCILTARREAQEEFSRTLHGFTEFCKLQETKLALEQAEMMVGVYKDKIQQLEASLKLAVSELEMIRIRTHPAYSIRWGYTTIANKAESIVSTIRANHPAMFPEEKK